MTVVLNNLSLTHCCWPIRSFRCSSFHKRWPPPKKNALSWNERISTNKKQDDFFFTTHGSGLSFVSSFYSGHGYLNFKQPLPFKCHANCLRDFNCFAMSLPSLPHESPKKTFYCSTSLQSHDFSTEIHFFFLNSFVSTII